WQTACAGAVAPEIARSISLAYPAIGNAGRVSWAHSDVGAASEGAVTIPLRAAAAALRPPPGFATPPRPNGPRPSLIYVIDGGGSLHTINVSNGDEMAAPMEFVRSGSAAQGLTVVDTFAYAVTHPCNGTGAGVWAVDLATRQVVHWSPANPAKSPDADVAGSGGVAFAPDGTIYAATTAGKLVALAAKTLAVKDSYDAGSPFTSSPVVFSYKGRNLVAAATRDGSIHLIDAASSALISKTLPNAQALNPGVLAAWQSPAGARSLLASSSDSVTAWTVEEHDGAIALKIAWSRNIKGSLPPTIINGVVFLLSSNPAVLRALDGATGTALWDSGKTIAGIAGGGLTGGASQLYLSTQDGTIYAFGFPIEH
ncbi:MAG TPA: PQQ-binding-like beta-propeller repeat protein, partial [Bryobacteraceae bacterium]|nr:PQQ-binding-like beta-propeller repeat protein [Bryobacteraceae bacterium]